MVTEAHLEEEVLHIFKALGFETLHGPDIAPGEIKAERESYGQIILSRRLKDSITDLNPIIPSDVKDLAFRKIINLTAPTTIGANKSFHKMLVEGIEVEYRRKDGSIAGDMAKVIDFEHPEVNNFLAVNQFRVEENGNKRRADVVLFVNGIPLVVIELKNPADEKATIWTALNQLQTYKKELPSLFNYNEALIISDGLEARIGTLTSDRERFMPWRTVEGEALAPSTLLESKVLLEGVCEKHRLLELIRHFIVFEDNERGEVIKKMAGYHQFHAVRKAVEHTAEAAKPGGDRRIGVVWHTQGSGKSLTMAFYAGKIILDPRMQNPTIVVITDRNDLDDQLFGTFCRCQDLLRQTPVQAEDREDLRKRLTVASGGVVFTTIQKFFPEQGKEDYPMLSDRRNIVVIADEAHRSQYDFIDGFARHMRDALPNASFIGFTGTPLELADKSTRAVFGDYISIYDIQRAVVDGATVPIYYESRLAKVELKESEKPKLDEEFEEVTEGEEEEHREKLKTKWAALEALVGADKRIQLIAKDLVAHFENRQGTIEGKGMVVCMSRRICVQLYDEIVKLRPEWHDNDDSKGKVKIVMTGSASDPVEWQQHIRNKAKREQLALRFKDPRDEFKLVIVRDMWLTGFDVPCLHTMYLDKPMRGHGLMQAIARVNRVFKDKPGGLVVDYLGLADQLRQAMAIYTESGGKGKTAIDQKEAIAVMLEKYDICCGVFHGFEWRMSPTEQLNSLRVAMEHVLKQQDGKERFLTAVSELSKAFALSVPSDEALSIRDDVGYFQTVRAGINKISAPGQQTSPELDFAIRQIVSSAIASDHVIDIFEAVGLKKPDIYLLSDVFLAEVRKMPQRNLAVELLNRLLKDEIRTRSRNNLVQSRSFTAMLEVAITKYEKRAVTTAQVIEMLIQIAKEMKEAQERGRELGLNNAELAFYDALETNDSAVKILGDDVLKQIAKDITNTINSNATIDWSVRESARANMRRLVKRVLRKHNYPPDKQEKATKTVLEQAELLCGELAVT